MWILGPLIFVGGVLYQSIGLKVKRSCFGMETTYFKISYYATKQEFSY